MRVHRPEVSIAGIGVAGFVRTTDRSVTSLAHEAIVSALDDARLRRDEIDGLFVHIGSPRGMDYDSLANLMGLNVDYVGQAWAHGRFTSTVLQHAAMTIREGLATYALCVGVVRNSAYSNYGTRGFPDFSEALRDGGGPHAETPAAGLAAPLGAGAMSTRRYLETFGVDREKLGTVALAQRAWAADNERAAMRELLTAHDYESSPYIIEPLRLLDCSVPIDWSVAVILTTTERAADHVDIPVRLLGFQGMQAGPEEFVFGQPGLGIHQPTSGSYKPSGSRERVFLDAGLGPDDVDALHCYDGLSAQVLWTLERFGYCAPGEAADWIQGGTTMPGGALPVNTSGGNLSEGHSNGWGHLAEIVAQLRGEAGHRQIADCRVAQWATTFGDSVIYGR